MKHVVLTVCWAGTLSLASFGADSASRILKPGTPAVVPYSAWNAATDRQPLAARPAVQAHSFNYGRPGGSVVAVGGGVGTGYFPPQVRSYYIVRNRMPNPGPNGFAAGGGGWGFVGGSSSGSSNTEVREEFHTQSISSDDSGARVLPAPEWIHVSRAVYRAPISQVTGRPEEKKESRPRIAPIHEASGPLYNERSTALEYQRQNAEKGNPEAQYAMGIRYLNGNDVEADEQTARAWLEKASSQGNLRARTKLSELNHPFRQ